MFWVKNITNVPKCNKLVGEWWKSIIENLWDKILNFEFLFISWATCASWNRTQAIRMDCRVFHCDVPHQWIAQWQVNPMSVYCDGCHVLCLRHGIHVWQHIVTTATSRHRCDDLRCLKTTLNPNKNKQIDNQAYIFMPLSEFLYYA